MKRIVMAMAALAMMVGCGGGEKPADNGLNLMKEENFKCEIDGKPVSLYTLTNGTLTMQVTNFGGRVVSLWVPDRDGKMADIVLGYENIDRYVHNTGERFLGAAVGRVANRINEGRFTLNGKEYSGPQNSNGQMLHGGDKGIDMIVWDVVDVMPSSIVLRCTLPDGQDGFPGNLTITMTYTLTPDNEFKVLYLAETDAPTLVNLSHHSFFNLKGEGNGTVLDNVLTIRASRTTPVDSVLIPTGEIADVTGTPFDFRQPHAIGERIEADNAQLRNGHGYDHNWIIDRRTTDEVELAATVYEPTTGRTLEVWSDQPALQFYSGNFFDGSSVGKTGKALRYRESLALETQKYPDSPNHADFPSTVLRPGETYTQTCIYRFGAK